METIKEANSIIKRGLALLPDDAKADFKAQASDIFINEAIGNALGAVNENEEKTALLKACMGETPATIKKQVNFETSFFNTIKSNLK